MEGLISRVTSTKDEICHFKEMIHQLISSAVGSPSSGAGSTKYTRGCIFSCSQNSTLPHAAIGGTVAEGARPPGSVSGDITRRSRSRPALMWSGMPAVRSELLGAPPGLRGKFADGMEWSTQLQPRYNGLSPPPLLSAAGWDNINPKIPNLAGAGSVGRGGAWENSQPWDVPYPAANQAATRRRSSNVASMKCGIVCSFGKTQHHAKVSLNRQTACTILSSAMFAHRDRGRRRENGESGVSSRVGRGVDGRYQGWRWGREWLSRRQP